MLARQSVELLLAAREFVLDASTFDVWVGGDSTAPLRTTFTTTTAAG